MDYMIAAYLIVGVTLIGYVLLQRIRRKRLMKEIEFLKQLELD